MAIILFVLALTIISVTIHHGCLIGVKNSLLKPTRQPQHWIVGTTVVLLLLAHMLEIGFFALGYFVIDKYFNAGQILGENSEGITAALYFSFSCYTTLGIGDLYPTGAMRLLSGFEGLLGLLMIGWSASFLYLEMRTLWSYDQ